MFILSEQSSGLAYEGNSSELFWEGTQFRYKSEHRLPQVPPYSTVQRNSGLVPQVGLRTPPHYPFHFCICWYKM